MKNIFKFLYHKYKTFKTNELYIGLRCKPVASLKRKYVNCHTIIIKPCKLQILTKGYIENEAKYVSKHYGAKRTIYGKCPIWSKEPSYIKGVYKCPTNHNEIIPFSTKLSLKYADMEDNIDNEIIFDEPVLINNTLPKEISLAKRISLQNLIELENLLNNELLNR